MDQDYKRLSDALRFCGGGKEPCYSCPFYAELSPFDCQTQIMLKAAEVIEQMAKANN